MDNQKVTEIVLQKTQELMGQLNVDNQIEVNFDEESGYHKIQIESETPGLLIGYRGENLSALQIILRLFVSRALTQESESEEENNWIKLTVNVGDYRERREETLTQLAHNAAQRVAYSGESYVFEHLSPAERRIVHMALKEHLEVETVSEGEGKRRRLVVVKK